MVVICNSAHECSTYEEDCYHKPPHIKDEIEPCDWEFCDNIENDVTCVAYVEPHSDIDDAFDDLLDDLGIKKVKIKKKNKRKKMKWKVVENPDSRSGGWDVVRDSDRKDDYWTTADDVWEI
jgi:hypothetical protein